MLAQRSLLFGRDASLLVQLHLQKPDKNRSSADLLQKNDSVLAPTALGFGRRQCNLCEGWGGGQGRQEGGHPDLVIRMSSLSLCEHQLEAMFGAQAAAVIPAPISYGKCDSTNEITCPLLLKCVQN